MPSKSCLTHDEAREKVCAVCTNQFGLKAARKVTESEEKLMKQNVLRMYSSINTLFPSGICIRCLHHLSMLERGEKVELKLPLAYNCQLGWTGKLDPVVNLCAAAGGAGWLG